MKMWVKFFTFLFLSLGQYIVNAQSTIPKKVLFVGNSYTYFWNLPQTVAAMAEAKNIALNARQSTSGGVHWGHHWRGERALQTITKIEKGDFDAVILQNHSMSALNRADSLLYFGKLLGDLIKKSNGQSYVYMTWARAWDPYMQPIITEKYTQLAEHINAQLIPVGLAWQRALELRPDLSLYDADGSHPSPLGTYLTACVFFGVLTQQSPVGLPERLTTTDKDGEKMYLNIQTKGDALFCQKVAEETISKYVD